MPRTLRMPPPWRRFVISWALVMLTLCLATGCFVIASRIPEPPQTQRLIAHLDMNQLTRTPDNSDVQVRVSVADGSERLLDLFTTLLPPPGSSVQYWERLDTHEVELAPMRDQRYSLAMLGGCALILIALPVLLWRRRRWLRRPVRVTQVRHVPPTSRRGRTGLRLVHSRPRSDA